MNFSDTHHQKALWVYLNVAIELWLIVASQQSVQMLLPCLLSLTAESDGLEEVPYRKECESSV